MATISTPLERGDVVLIDDRKAEYAIKRIIGLPGETVQLWRGRVFINRQMLVEPCLPKKVYTCPVGLASWSATFVLGEKEYFVLGDNRIYSTDSRAYGPVNRRQIKRRVPLPENSVWGYFAPYTLPSCGNTLAQPAGPNRTGPQASL
jgi:signal peptidase I